MKKSITIKDGTSKSQLLKAIQEYEDTVHTTVLSVVVHTGHMYTLIEFDGISVGKWIGDVDDFINEGKTALMTLVQVM